MRTLEIIQMRSAGSDLGELANQISETIRNLNEGNQVAKLFLRSGLETDIAVHIHRDSNTSSGGKSEIGLRLAAALRNHGIVEHTIWKEA